MQTPGNVTSLCKHVSLQQTQRNGSAVIKTNLIHGFYSMRFKEILGTTFYRQQVPHECSSLDFVVTLMSEVILLYSILVTSRTAAAGI